MFPHTATFEVDCCRRRVRLFHPTPDSWPDAESLGYRSQHPAHIAIRNGIPNRATNHCTLLHRAIALTGQRLCGMVGQIACDRSLFVYGFEELESIPDGTTGKGAV